MAPLSEDIAQSVERLQASWIAQHPWTAVLIAVCLALVLGAVVGDFRQGQIADGYLKQIHEWSTAYKRDIAATEKAAEQRIELQKKKTVAANAKYATLKKTVEEANAASKRPWAPPTTGQEMLERFHKLGYPGVHQ